MDGITWTASAMRAARAQLEVATQNLAAAGRDGFRRVTATLALTERGVSVRTAPSPDQGGLRTTGGRFDLALLGPGGFEVDGGSTRAGAFVRDRDGWLVDPAGRRLHGLRGPLRVGPEATVAPDGSVREDGRVLDRLRLPAGTGVRSGALETANVDAIAETVAILGAQRAFETAEKALSAIDAARQKAIDDVGRLK